MFICGFRLSNFLWLVSLFVGIQAHSRAGETSFVREIKPLLQKYCGGCHNEADREGDFSVASFEAIAKGTPDRSVLKPGDADSSLMINLVKGNGKPRMPPEDEPQPTLAEIAKLESWIASGAKNDAEHVPLNEQILAPKLASDPQAGQYITALVDVDKTTIAVARLGVVELLDTATQQVVFKLSQLSGKVNQLRLSPDRARLIIASGVAGVGGEAIVFDIPTKEIVGRVQGHTDTIYCVAMTPDGNYLATGSYDRSVVLWDWRQKKVVRTFAGHNGAINDLDFDPTGKVLATACADQTVKLWGVHDGQRLDTLGQPEGEMLCVRFTPDGDHILASGADRQLRLWQILSKEKPTINPLRISRFAHEDPVTQLVFRNEQQVISLSHDHTVKLWQVDDLMPLGQIHRSGDVPVGIGGLQANADHVLVADFLGNLATVHLPGKTRAPTTSQNTLEASASQAIHALKLMADNSVLPITELHEIEPNNGFNEATRVTLPVNIRGVVSGGNAGNPDVDLFAFEAKAGVPWVIEVNAARSNSRLDSLVDILDERGRSVVRTRLQAVRESYFTFRGKDSMTSDDFRMHKWQEMELNEWLYSNGEVVKLWLYPRGPDSGFKVYPGYGSRNTFFDTTPTAHALGEMAYVVRELGPSEEPLPNGLPIFPVHYQNDDDGARQWGKDSRLNFTAPRDGHYIVRMRDARSFGGEDFTYQLMIRAPKPDFSLDIKGMEMTMPRGSGREWHVTAKRLDGLDGPIEIRLDNVPDGFLATNPLVIEAGQDIAYGNVYASDKAKLPDGLDKVNIKLTARSRTALGEVVHEMEKPLTVAIAEKPDVELKLVDATDSARELEEISIRPGHTINARVIVSRNGLAGPIGLGKEDAGRNLPHGAFVDNIGLNGLLITDVAPEREFFITAAPWLKPQERMFHLRSDTKNNPTSRSVLLRVLPK